ncbi:MAG: AsmA family protein [Elusimicrobiaceae bacterium]|nr:AsmA family protein [Elusimicrobiaceae bacterium]
MKKIFKILSIIFVSLVVLFALALFALKLMFPIEKVKAQVQEQVKNKLDREVRFKDFSLSFRGVNITDFALSEKTTFKDGTFIEAKQAHASIDLKALLHKQIKIESIGLNGLTLNIIKDKEGKFNFDDLLSGEEQTTLNDTPNEQTGQVLQISAKQLYTKEATINFKDEATDTNFSVNNLNIQIDDFDLSKEFSIIISCLSKIKMAALTLDPVLFQMQAKIDLASLDLQKAKTEITDFAITYDRASLNLKGLVADFNNPQLNLSGTFKGIDNNLISHFTKDSVSTFSMPLINIILSAKFNLENSTADISQAKASIGNSFIKTKASLNYSAPEMVFSSNTNIAISLDEVAAIAKDTLEEFKLKGSINGTINASQNKKLNVNGSLALKDIGARLLNQDLEKTNGTITIKSLEDIFTNKISGLFALQPWDLTLAYKKSKNTNIDLSFYMKKFTLEDIDFDTFFETKEDSSQQKETAPKAEEKQPQNSDLYNLKADITIDKIENNVLTANNFVIKTDISDFDTSFAKAKGSLSLVSKDIEIRDIDKLMSSSKLFKVMFTSVKIMQKAFNFAKLDNTSITNGIIKCSIINTECTLKDGILNVNKSDIDSDLTIVRAFGNADLVKDSVNMKIQAQLGKTGSNGFKPVVINVKGSLSDPSYKVDVLSSLASILSKGTQGDTTEQQDATKDVKSNAGEVIKTIGSLFKKDK